MEKELSVLLAETVELVPLGCTLQKSLYSDVYLEEMKLTLELHFTGEEEPMNRTHEQCLVTGQCHQHPHDWGSTEV